MSLVSRRQPEAVTLAATSPIGVFDSGLGGLTVLSAVHERLPNENLIYFGDTARVPYGSKSKETIIHYSLEILEFLLQQKVKAVVVACNTASSHALEALREKSPVPVIGVVEPGVAALARHYPEVKRAAVIATRSTVKSNAYAKLVQQHLGDVHLYQKACPLFVPLVEEGFAERQVTELIIREYLDEIVRDGYSHVILGCTHYPLLKKSIKRIYPQLTLIDSSSEVAHALQELLRQHQLLNNAPTKGEVKLYVSDITDSLLDLEKIFFGKTIHSLEKKVLGW